MRDSGQGLQPQCAEQNPDRYIHRILYTAVRSGVVVPDVLCLSHVAKDQQQIVVFRRPLDLRKLFRLSLWPPVIFRFEFCGDTRKAQPVLINARVRCEHPD
jgi:hypothetical protein